VYSVYPLYIQYAGVSAVHDRRLEIAVAIPCPIHILLHPVWEHQPLQQLCAATAATSVHYVGMGMGAHHFLTIACVVIIITARSTSTANTNSCYREIISNCNKKGMSSRCIN
jgi:hypothetical protein